MRSVRDEHANLNSHLAKVQNDRLCGLASRHNHTGRFACHRKLMKLCLYKYIFCNFALRAFQRVDLFITVPDLLRRNHDPFGSAIATAWATMGTSWSGCCFGCDTASQYQSKHTGTCAYDVHELARLMLHRFLLGIWYLFHQRSCIKSTSFLPH